MKASLKAIGKACQAAGFEPAMQAAAHFIDNGRDMNETDLTPLARRIADGDLDYGNDLPDLEAYDVFNHPEGAKA